VMTLFVGFVAARQHRKAHDRAHEMFHTGVDKTLAQPKILMLVVTQTERGAVINAVHEANGEPARIVPRGLHSVFELGSLGGATILLAQSSGQGMSGPTGMMLTAEDVIRKCRPDYVILTGTCYGLWDDEQRLGDICVPQQVQDLDPRTETDEGTLLQGEIVSPSPTLLDRFTVATHGRAPDAPKVHFGRMLASNTGLRSPERREKIRKDDPYAMGGEKELAAVYAAAARQKTDWIAVKGISDWGTDMTWSSDNQTTAARNAADFVVDTIRSGDLGEGPEPDRLREKP
jgi:nucleoside phosphorylase